MTLGKVGIFLAGAAASALVCAVLVTNQAVIGRLLPDQVLADVVSKRADGLARNDAVMRRLADVRAQQYARSGVRRRLDLAKRHEDLVQASPQLGEASRSLVLFFDYDCVPCKAEEQMLRTMSRGERPFAIRYLFIAARGTAAETAAVAALVAERKGRFEALHDRMLKVRGGLTDEAVLAAAADAGVSEDEIGRELTSGGTDATFEATRTFAEALGVTGTPAILMGGDLLTGLQPEAVLKARLQTN